jgi:hypothetical protein
MSVPSLAHQVVTDITEDLFCGFATEPIYVAVITEGGKKADRFDSDLYNFISLLSRQCKDDIAAPSNMWQALENCNIVRGIATAVSNHVRSLASYRGAAAADTEIGYLMSVKDEEEQDGVSAAKQPVPKFNLDYTTAQALVDCKAYFGLTIEAHAKILAHKSYFSFVSQELHSVQNAYFARIVRAIEQDASLWRHRVLSAWAKSIAEIPPHLIRFTPYDPGRKPGVWSLFKSKKDQHRPGYVRMHWVCGGRGRHLDIPERIVEVTKAAIATAPKVPYLATEWASNVPLFNDTRYWEERRVKDAPVPKHEAERWASRDWDDRYQCDPVGV